jgi:hypothetical protein
MINYYHRSLKRMMLHLVLLLVILSLSGCIHTRVTIDINPDGSGDFSVLLGMTQEARAMMSGDLWDMGDAVDPFDGFAAQFGEGYSNERWIEGEYEYIEVATTFSDLEELQSKLTSVDFFETFNLSRKTGLFRNTYVLDAELRSWTDAASTSGSTEIEPEIDPSTFITGEVVIHLPGRIIERNGALTEDGGILWTVASDHRVNMQATSVVWNWLNIGVIGIICAAVILGEGILVLLFTRKHHASSRIQSQSPTFLITKEKPSNLSETKGTLQEAFALTKTGDKERARSIIAHILYNNRDEIRAWAIAARLCSTREEAVYCLEEILRIKPGDEWTQRQLDQLLAQSLAKQKHSPMNWAVLAVTGILIVGIGFLIIVSVLFVQSRSDTRTAFSRAMLPATPTPAPTATPDLPEGVVLDSARSSPVPVGDLVIVEDMMMTIGEEVFRPIPSETLLEANMFNPTPEPGNEYIGVGAVATCLKDEDDSCFLSSYDFSLLGSDGIRHDPELVMNIPEILSSVEFYGDATAGGLLIFEVRQGEHNLILVYEPAFGLGNAAYFEVSDRVFNP